MERFIAFFIVVSVTIIVILVAVAINLKKAEYKFRVLESDIDYLNSISESSAHRISCLESEKQDAIKPDRKKGRWVTPICRRRASYEMVKGYYECDQCHAWETFRYSYCPWCGADMRRERDGLVLVSRMEDQ